MDINRGKVIVVLITFFRIKVTYEVVFQIFKCYYNFKRLRLNATGLQGHEKKFNYFCKKLSITINYTG